MTMIIPSEESCMDLLNRIETPEHIIAHSVQVWRVAQLVGEGLIQNGLNLNIDLLRAACLLHDIAKFPCIQSGKGYHDAVGREMLDREGLPAIGRIIAQHVVLRDEGEDSIREEHVLNYSDKRVVHDKVVSLEERFVYLKETYGKYPQAIEALDAMKSQTRILEKKIFQLLEFEPQDVPHLMNKELKR